MFWYGGRLWVYLQPFKPPQLAADVLPDDHQAAAIDRLAGLARLEAARSECAGTWSGQHGPASESADWPLYQQLHQQGWRVVRSPWRNTP
jgi:hypothetical protein